MADSEAAPAVKRINKQRTDEEKLKIVDDWLASGLTARDYQTRSQVAQSLLWKWKKKLRPSKATKLKKRTQYTDKQKQKYIQAWKKSGLNAYQFGRKINIHPAQIYNWASDIKKEKKTGTRKSAAAVADIKDKISAKMTEPSAHDALVFLKMSRAHFQRLVQAGAIPIDEPALNLVMMALKSLGG